MKWSESAWNSVQPIYRKILELPFVEELISGTLDRDKFNFYIQQDALYLAQYGKVMMGLSSKLKDPQHAQAFINFASESIAVERVLHQSFVEELSVNVEASPSCFLYTSFLISQLASAPVEVIAAAVLPCFRIYQEVGDYILENQTEGANPYQNWINTYGGQEFADSVILATSICDQIAEQCTTEQQEAMTEAFVMASKMEWMFWESAWKQERWEI